MLKRGHYHGACTTRWEGEHHGHSVKEKKTYEHGHSERSLAESKNLTEVATCCLRGSSTPFRKAFTPLRMTLFMICFLNRMAVTLALPASGLIGLILLLFIFSGRLAAEDVVTIEGQLYSNVTLRRAGALVMIKLPAAPGASAGVEMGLPAARIAKVTFVRPPELDKAVVAAGKGDASQVISLTESYLASQAQFKDLPGSPWFEMARLRLLALAASGKDAQTVELARQISPLQFPGADSIARFGALGASDPDAVIAGANGLPKVADDMVTPLVQLALGRALLLKKDAVPALKTFLAIKVFSPSVDLLQAPALMGAAECYIRIKDPKRAAQSWGEIAVEWPDSPLAPEAKKKAESSKP